jgi:hypothetical protein
VKRLFKPRAWPCPGFLLLLFLPTLAAAQPATITATAEPDRKTIQLSGHLQVKLAVEGPAPLRVELPTTLLDAESDLAWRLRPAAPPTLSALPGGRERWSQTFRLDPFARGKAVHVAFAPLKVQAGGEPAREVPVTAFEVEVQSRFDNPEVKPDPSKATVTGIEELPPRPPPPPDPTGWVIVAGAAGVIAIVVVVGVVRRARRKPPPLPPVEWATAELDRLARTGPPGVELAERLAAVLREFVARKFGLPAPKLTTGELVDEAGRAEWPADSTATLGELLDRCDRAKFAGDAPDAAEGSELLDRAREWVTAHAAPA